MLVNLRHSVLPTLNICRNVNGMFLSTTAVPKEEKIKVGNCDINYLKVGTGPHNVLCLPGALGTIWTDFRAQVEGFDRDKFTLVAWDPPGYGKSRPPDKQFDRNFYEVDADCAHEFMKALQIPKYSLLGWSGGGISSLIFAAKYPNAVIKMVVWGCKSYGLPHELEFYNKIKDTRTWSQKMRQPMVEIYGEDVLAKLWAQWVEGMHYLHGTNNASICAECLKDIKCPTFILCGAKDQIVDAVHVSHLHENIERSRIHLYPDGKHNIHITFAQDFNQRVQEILLEP